MQKQSIELRPKERIEVQAYRPVCCTCGSDFDDEWVFFNRANYLNRKPKLICKCVYEHEQGGKLLKLRQWAKWNSTIVQRLLNIRTHNNQSIDVDRLEL